MTKGLTFVEAFWDSDIVASNGWDKLNRRMKDGKKVCVDIAHYFKERAKAELEYSKALQHLARKADGKEETGVLGVGWSQLKDESEKMYLVHEAAGGQFNSLYIDLTKFNEDQSKQKKQHEEAVKRSSQNKVNEYQKVQNLRKSYEQKSRERDVAKESYETCKRTVTSKRNEVEKAKLKYEKCKETVYNADVAYKSSIESLDAARMNWERQMETACKELEELEIARLTCLRDKIWICTNIDSKACVEHDVCCETVRDKLESCDVLVDLQSFIQENQSYGQRPAPVEYVAYHSNKGAPGATNANRTGAAIRPPDFRPPAVPPVPRPENNLDEEGPYATVGAAPSPPPKLTF